jgi:hypothetical protein
VSWLTFKDRSFDMIYNNLKINFYKRKKLIIIFVVFGKFLKIMIKFNKIIHKNNFIQLLNWF